MCGFVGFWQSRGGVDADLARRMSDAIAHRGPDGSGVWVDDAAGIALAHLRLAILDLSPAGHQPMASPCGRYQLVYNGEIYNHLELRAELEAEGGAFEWQGHSDTETLLASLRHWGIERTLTRLNGMFSFALWDSADRTLFLARDRMGEKPLYYGHIDGTFLFLSELKAIESHPEWRGEIDRDALSLFLRHNYVPAPWSIYKGIKKLPPAHFVAIREQGKDISEPYCYWDLVQVAQEGSASTAFATGDAVDELEELLGDAVRRRMAADVPLGAFLSGGYDSTAVVALMQSQATRRIKTFSIGFPESAFDEAPHAKAVADHLGTDHTELYVSSKEAMSVIPQLPAIYDEPFSDSSQIPTYLVSQLARQQVTVALSGDGGDELFYGYSRYQTAQKLWKALNLAPARTRRVIAVCAANLPGPTIDRFMAHLPEKVRIPRLSSRLPLLSELMMTPSFDGLYQHLMSHWKAPEEVVLGGREPRTTFNDDGGIPADLGAAERMMLLDMMTYLPDDILTKVDRASMSVSLEARVPLLDHRLVEFSWRVPLNQKFRNGVGKWLLREVVHQYVPKKLMERPKMGFGVPIDAWLKGEMRDWAEGLLDEQRLKEEGFFNPKPIRKMWQEHLTGTHHWHYYLWDVLMFQAWHTSRSAVNSDLYVN